MSENVTPAQIEAIMRNVVAEENYGIHPTSLLCVACSTVLMPLMESLLDGIHPMSLL